MNYAPHPEVEDLVSMVLDTDDGTAKFAVKAAKAAAKLRSKMSHPEDQRNLLAVSRQWEARAKERLRQSRARAKNTS